MVILKRTAFATKHVIYKNVRIVVHILINNNKACYILDIMSTFTINGIKNKNFIHLLSFAQSSHINIGDTLAQ